MEEETTVGTVVREKATNMARLVLPKMKSFVDDLYSVIYHPETVEEVENNWKDIEQNIFRWLTKGVAVAGENGETVNDPAGSSTDEELVREVRNNIFLLNSARLLATETDPEMNQSCAFMLQLIGTMAKMELKKFCEEAVKLGRSNGVISEEEAKAIGKISFGLIASLATDKAFLIKMVRYYNCFVSLIVVPEKQ
jgi:hypothetical protein